MDTTQSLATTMGGWWGYRRPIASRNRSGKRLDAALAVGGFAATNRVVFGAAFLGQSIEHGAHLRARGDGLLEVPTRQRQRPHFGFGTDGRDRGAAGQQRHFAEDVAAAELG